MILCAALCAWSLAVRESAVAGLVWLMVPTLVLSTPPIYARCPRPVCDVLRFSMGCCISLCVCAMLVGHVVVSITCGLVLFVFWWVYFRMRRTRRATACEGCPELGRKGICTGCQLQAEAIRAYETEATAILLASGKTPWGN
jgi:hypothetical protein